MKFEFKLSSPDDVEASMTITMTLAQWKVLKRDLSESSWASNYMANSIRSLVAKASESFEAETAEER